MFFEENKIFETILNKETSQAFHLYKAIRKETYSASQSDHISRVNFPLSPIIAEDVYLLTKRPLPVICKFFFS